MATLWYQAVHAAKRFRLGTEKTDMDGRVYVYLKGGTSVAADSWVSFTTTYAAVLLASDAIGRVAIANATVDATTKFGWFLVKGFYTTANSDTVAGANGLFIDGTAGRVDDASVAGDFIVGAVATAADATNKLPVYIDHPYVSNTVPA